MKTKIKFNSVIDEIEPIRSVEQISSQMPLYNMEKYSSITKIGHLNYSTEFIPSRGRFPAAQFTGYLLLSRHPQKNTDKNTPCISLSEFEAKLEKSLSKEVYLYLYDIADGIDYGHLLLHKNLLPDWLEEESDVGYIVIQLEYDHEATKDQTNRTDEELNERRDTYREKFTEWEENEF